uniref:AlNc14C334G10723 protein n=1 Tax=Albugo laibachii Nc14 TaxID=890382 RepID=F0WWW2_9STRA|nr:AlNc14C334G10723 [Albugo laibachii Nc14]|eukprot:CCA25947.1 AlNc14C334G10723 [Albugo laibachii Nc14]
MPVLVSSVSRKDGCNCKEKLSKRVPCSLLSFVFKPRDSSLFCLQIQYNF